MTAKPTTVSTSIIWDDKKPIWDFNETTAYPVVLQQGSKSPTVHVYLSPYESDELKTILRKASSGYRRERRDVEIVREDREIYTPLCDAHFVKLGNATGTPDAQKAWLDKYPELKPSIIEHTFGGLQMDPPENAEEHEDILDISLELSGSLAVYQDIFDPVTGEIVRVNMRHNYTHPTESQYRDYRSARKNKFIRRQSLWTVTEAHGTLEKLYDTVIESVDGAAADGVTCTADTKAHWIGFVPLWHKLWIVDQIFGELIEKND